MLRLVEECGAIAAPPSECAAPLPSALDCHSNGGRLFDGERPEIIPDFHIVGFQFRRDERAEDNEASEMARKPTAIIDRGCASS
jgi:hypothetical protein